MLALRRCLVLPLSGQNAVTGEAGAGDSGQARSQGWRDGLTGHDARDLKAETRAPRRTAALTRRANPLADNGGTICRRIEMLQPARPLPLALLQASGNEC